jgi:hypothetical protein
MISKRLKHRATINYIENLNRQDSRLDNFYQQQLGAAVLEISRIDSPRPDRQDYLDLMIQNFPPITEEQIC